MNRSIYLQPAALVLPVQSLKWETPGPPTPRPEIPSPCTRFPAPRPRESVYQSYYGDTTTRLTLPVIGLESWTEV